ncbi:hypothetical protein [Seinonella peptonophila]|uniref:hypothetical protein n=1 Tax=Seinonella peptonophila TaxID=112248 RepID=UPI000934EF16|nr:hypothetical protein [Seinonella peptonophila]
MLKLIVMGCTGELNRFINDFLTDKRFEVHRLLAEEGKRSRGLKMIGADFQLCQQRESPVVTVHLETKDGQKVPIELLNDSSLKIEVSSGNISIIGKSYDIFSPPTIVKL